ncbi:Transcriptional regulator containing an amidase domain and an AraC-type DNA-binding HTH domain [Curtobacterium sp. 314Chir4.1]|uniref:helix-turn-helix domain-containing protein n=1 Tax=Curtobacterium sp. 314Chir4.1 TaxID=1279028 RepID=UPI000BD8A98F|nr:helix-turn-helix domain-containing protein [Curtobacterium sp. 314Chir4.1]SOC88810.1 Transcriptional regulator containing an amidase domain and an AraC-type DNA-binding HTH domain [Curtobacterium sp. 314Chir4.1]
MTSSEQTFDYVTGGDDEVSLRRIRTDGPQSGTIGPRPDHVVFVLADGRATLTADDGSEWEVEAGRPMMLSAPVAYAFDTDATAMTLLHVTPAVLGDGDELSEFVQPEPEDPGVEPLLTLLNEVTDRILDPSLDGAERAALNRRVATVVLSTFTRSRSDVEHRLRRAIRFVHDHASEDLTVADVAAAADLSERGLQDLFRRRLAVTPMRYLREVRLDRVHLELAARRNRLVTVGDVARAWRFAHLGRFAAAYRRRFGESPHETLRRTGHTEG